MQVIHEKFCDGVFMLLEPIQLDNDQKSIVVISEKRQGNESWAHRSDSGKSRKEFALTEYKKKYPSDDVDLYDFQYVGIVPNQDCSRLKEDLLDGIEDKYDDI